MGGWFTRTLDPAEFMAHTIGSVVIDSAKAGKAYLLNFKVKGKNGTISVTRGHHALMLDLDGSSDGDFVRCVISGCNEFSLLYRRFAVRLCWELSNEFPSLEFQ